MRHLGTYHCLVQQDHKGSNKVAHFFILDVCVRPYRKDGNFSTIYYLLDFSFFMSQDDAHYQNHQNDPCVVHARVFCPSQRSLSCTELQ